MQLKAVHTVTTHDQDNGFRTHKPGTVFDVMDRAVGDDLIRRNAVTLISDASDEIAPAVVTATAPAQVEVKRPRQVRAAPEQVLVAEAVKTATQEDPA